MRGGDEDLSDVLSRLAKLEGQFRALAGNVHAAPGWAHPNYTEPQVLHPLRDLIKPGQTAFDVGANFGFLSLAMSRRAGPRGAVCAFEANPEIARRCQAALVRAGCGNTQVISAAVYHTSRQRLLLYLSENMVADSVARKISDRSIEVGTLALDDFVEDTALAPDFVKMDVEGAEFDVLCGFRRTLDRHSPILILEQQPGDDRCFRLLRERGYAALELRSYETIDNFSEIPEGIVVSDILYARPGQLDGTPYAAPILKIEECELGPDAFGWTSERMHETIAPINLRVSRYLIEAEFSARANVELKCGVAVDAVPIMQYHGLAGSLGRLARYWVVAVERDGPVSLFFHFPRQPDPTLSITRIKINRLPGFDGSAPLFA
jgi:FkbM family methyltransferase